MSTLFILSLLFMASAAFMLGTVVYDKLCAFERREKMRNALAGNKQPSSQSTALALCADLLLHGVPFLSSLANILLGIPRLASWLKDIELAVSIDGRFTTTVRALCELALAFLALSMLLSLLLLKSFIAGLGIFVLVAFLVHAKACKLRTQETEEMRAQLPDVLDSLGMCFSAGLSITQAFELVARESAEPLSHELIQVVDDINAGHSIQEALGMMEERSRVEELRFVAVALDIQNHTGGSFKPILEGACRSITNTLELMRLLSVQTTQARLSARVVSIMPLLLLVILSLAKPGYLATFFSSGVGMGILLVAIALEAGGIIAVRKILAVEVS